MKVTFWKHKLELLVGGLLASLLSLALLLAGVIQTILEPYFWPMILVGVVCVGVTVIAFVQEKRLLSKVTYSEEGIECNWCKTQVASIKWADVTDVVATAHERGTEDLSFVAKDTQIDVSLTKKMYDTIIEVCPNEDIKTKLNGIECFKKFHAEQK